MNPTFIAPAPNVAAAAMLTWGALRTGMGVGHYIDQAAGGAVSNGIANLIQRTVGPAPQGLINVADRLHLQSFDGRPSWMK
jgi:hypothetical protein